MRINLYGAPGIGKSVLAKWLSYKLASLNYKVELVQELAKEYAYRKESIDSFEQWYVFGCQIKRELDFLKYTDHIITDSPIGLNIYYSQRELWKYLLEYELAYPGIHIYLHKGNFEHKNEGRFHDEKTSCTIDVNMYKILDQNFFHPYNIDHLLVTLNESEYAFILNYITEKLA